MKFFNKLINLKSAIFLFVIFSFYVIHNYFWIAWQGNFQDGVDLGWHLCESADLYKNLLMLFHSDAVILSKFYKLISIFKTSGFWWPPLFHFITCIFYLIFGFSNLVARLIPNLFFFSILIISVYFIGKEIKDINTGILSAFLIAFYPVIFGMSRFYGIDFPLIAMVSLGIFILLKTDCFRNSKYSIAYGVVCGAGVLTKGAFCFFILGPMFYSFWRSMQERGYFLRRSTLNFIFATTLMVLISSLWWFKNWRSIIADGWFRFTSDYHYLIGRQDPNILLNMGSIKLFSPLWLLYYFLQIFTHIGYFFSFIFIISLPSFLKSKRAKDKMFIMLWIIVPYIFLTFSSLKSGRFYFPALPAIALISAFTIMEIKRSFFKILFVATITIMGLLQFYYLSFPLLGKLPDDFIYLRHSFRSIRPLPEPPFFTRPILTNDLEVAKDIVKTIQFLNQNKKAINIQLIGDKHGYGRAIIFKYLIYTLLPNAYIAASHNIGWDQIYANIHFDYLLCVQRDVNENCSLDRFYFNRNGEADITMKRLLDSIYKNSLMKYKSTYDIYITVSKI